jgi:preprotein translocase subunit Sec63
VDRLLGLVRRVCCPFRSRFSPAILGVERGASEDDLKKAFKKQAMK